MPLRKLFLLHEPPNRVSGILRHPGGHTLRMTSLEYLNTRKQESCEGPPESYLKNSEANTEELSLVKDGPILVIRKNKSNELKH